VVAWGQTNTNSVPTKVPDIKAEANNLLLALIPLAVPLIVAAAKTGIKFLPTWSLPIIAAGLGELLNLLSGLAGGPTTSVLGGVLLGAAGTGVREIVDQVKQSQQTEKV
jgi:hypothetical protein